MPTLLPFRDYDEHDVLNLYSVTIPGTTYPTKGTFVKVVTPFTGDTTQSLGSMPGAAFAGSTANPRWNVRANVTAITSSGENTIGMLLYDVRETDENSEVLLYRPQKQHELQAVLSGQTCPIISRGLFIYSGISGTVVAGSPAFLASDGGLSMQGSGIIGQVASTATRVGTFLGAPNAVGHTLVRINV